MRRTPTWPLGFCDTGGESDERADRGPMARLRGLLANAWRWLTGSSHAGGQPSDAIIRRSNQTAVSSVDRSAPALAAAGPAAPRASETAHEALPDGRDRPALPDRPTVTVQRRGDRLRVSRNEDGEAYLESDHWVAVRR